MSQATVVVGCGEVGAAVAKLLNADKHDPMKGLKVKEGSIYKFVHIAFPYNKFFMQRVKMYQKMFKPEVTIIHSTVPIGTCDRLHAVHSPVRGVHPNIFEGLLTFQKLFAGKDAAKAAKQFKNVVVSNKTHTSNKTLDVKVIKDAKTSEASKLWETTMYGALIALNKEIYAYCKKHKLDFDIVYKWQTETYNEGYNALGRPELTRPVLKYMKGKIGGHCVVENCLLLDTPTAKNIIRINKKLK